MKPTFTLQSPETGTTYAIFIGGDDRPSKTEARPAMLFMDGDDQFVHAVKAYQALLTAGEVVPLLLVGVGYGGSYTSPDNKRGRDYTPTPHSDEPTSGGAEGFVDFLQGTLWTALADRYPLRNDIRGIGGHSLGSLLALHALLREPTVFNRVLASAPSLWWDKRSILRLVAERHARNPKLPARLFLSVGENDTESMTGDLALLERQLSEKPFHGLDVISQRFQGCDHYDVLPQAFSAGLSALFGRGHALRPGKRTPATE